MSLNKRIERQAGQSLLDLPQSRSSCAERCFVACSLTWFSARARVLSMWTGHPK